MSGHPVPEYLRLQAPTHRNGAQHAGVARATVGIFGRYPRGQPQRRRHPCPAEMKIIFVMPKARAMYISGFVVVVLTSDQLIRTLSRLGGFCLRRGHFVKTISM